MTPEVLPNKGIVMIIDDTPENLALLSDTLSDAGYRVLVATDGESALEQIDYLQPDIILLDVLMPGIDGFETCQRLKSKPQTAAIPILFMTALSELDKLLQGFDEGAVDYLVKPVRPPEVLARLEVQLKQLQNIQRAETVVNNSPYAALVLDNTGIITWVSAAGLHWLCEFYQLLPEQIKIGTELSKPLLDWFKVQIQLSNNNDSSDFNQVINDVHFTVKLQRRVHNSEYLLVLEKYSNQWNVESVKNSLGLTLREAEILMWISKGKTNKEVGLILESSPRTVNKHLEHIFEKLGVATRAAAVSIVMQRTSKATSLKNQT